jgi:simple sugar transport system permease protein
MSASYFWAIISGAFQAMVPITLAATGEVINESAGLFNIGLEGILLISAMTGALGAELGGPFVGLLIGFGTGFGIGLLFGLIATYLMGNQLITGVGINLFALGFVAFWLIHLGVPGHHAVPRNCQVPDIPTPWGGISPMIIFAILMPILAYLLLFRTKLGLKIRAVGETPHAADVAGVNVNLLRLLCCAFGAGLVGLGGVYLSIDWIGSVTKEISAGRGFIALATVVFSGLNPLLVLLGGLIFGFFDYLATWISTLPNVRAVMPWQFVAMLPYIVTLATLLIVTIFKRVRFPSALGKPYQRE